MGRKSREKRTRRAQWQKEILAEKYPKGFQSKLELIFIRIICGATYLMLLTPLVVSKRFFFPFVGPKGLYLMALIEVVFFAWLVLAIYFPKYRPKKNLLFLSLATFIIILTLATIFGADPSRSFWSKFERMSGLLMWFHLFAFFVAGSSVFKKRDWLKIFIFSILVAIITCFLFWAEQAGGTELPVARNGSTLGNSSFFATYLLFNLFFSIYLFLALRKLKDFTFLLIKSARNACMVIAVLGFVIMFFSLMFSTGRAAILAFFGAIGLLLLLYLAFEIKKKNLRLLGRIALVISIMIFIVGIVSLHWYQSPTQEWFAERANRSRQAIWQNVWQGFKEQPILGWGPQNFPFVFNKFFNSKFYLSEEYGPDVRFDQAHNIIMDNLADAGILGLAGYLSIFGACFWLLWRQYYKKRIDFWTASIPTVLLVAHLTQNLTVFDMPASFLMLFLTFGFVSSVSAEAVSPSEKLGKSKKGTGNILFLSLVLVFLFLSLFYFVIKPAKGNMGAIKIMMARNYEERVLAYEQALHSSPSGIYQIRVHLAQNLLAMVQANTAKIGDFEIIIHELERSIKSAPLDYFSYLTLGRVYGIYGETDEDKLKRGEEVLEMAVGLSPTKQEGYWELAKIKVKLGKNNEAIVLLEKAIELEPRVPRSHYLMVSFAKYMGNQELIEQKVKEAIKIMPALAPEIERILKEN